MSACPACGKENPAGFQFCGHCGVLLTVSSAEAAVRERKVVSILFCDVVGFTAASEDADPEDVQARMQGYYQRLRPTIESFGGTVEKYIGDAVMATFGAVVAHEDDPERAVRAGLAIVDAIVDLDDAAVAPGLAVRVGVNTGEVLVSRGSSAPGESEMLGDVVNTAARIQAAAPVNGVAVGESTFRATARVFEYQPLEAVRAKGKSRPVAVWRAVVPRAPVGSDLLRSMTSPLVGRSLELALLTNTFDKAVRDRAVQLVTVVGEPGVGKSRLVAELGAYVRGLEQPVLWRRGRCLPYGEGITFWALGEIVKQHAGIYESDSPEVATAKLDATLEEGDDRPWLRARLLPLIGIEAGEPARQEELFTAWRRFVESIADKGPLVVVVEDIHWADPAMLAFIEHLAEWVQGVALVLVCTARPELYETHPAWATGLPNHTSIRISPLSHDDTAHLVATLLDQAMLPAGTQQLLLERAGGNPLYAEEFVRMLRDRELLDPQGRLRADAVVPVPDSIHALIAARLDTVPLERKQLLQDAAVLGKVFWAGAVVAMGDRDADEVRKALHELARKELVRARRQSSMQREAEYGFSHALVRDVAYQQIPRAERALKHLDAAAWLERQAGERVEDVAEVLAYHTREALNLAQAAGDASLREQVTPAAARYALLAGERALGLDTARALALLEQARALTPDTDPALARVELRWAEAARQAGRFRDAADALEHAVSSFEARGDTLLAAEALTLLAGTRLVLGEPGYVVLEERAIALLEPTPGPELVAALGAAAGTQLVTGAYAAAIETAGRALTLAERSRLPVPGRALGYRGAARCFAGDLEGLEEMEHALELLVAAGEGRDAAILQHNLAEVRAFVEGPPASVAQFDRARDYAAMRGLTELAQASAANRVPALVGAGELSLAREEAETLAPLLRASGDRFACTVLGALAIVLVEQGHDAAEPAEHATRIARDTDEPLLFAWAAWGAAPALVVAGRASEAGRLLAEVADSDIKHNPEYGRLVSGLARAARDLHDRDLLARIAADIPDVLPIQQHALVTLRALQLEQAGEHEQAADLFGEAARRWERLTSVHEQAHALLGRGRCLAGSGDPAASQPLEDARALFEAMGAHARVLECSSLLAGAADRRSA